MSCASHPNQFTQLQREDSSERPMNTVESQIIAAHQELDAFAHGSPTEVQATDRMHALLVIRADALMGCTEGSEEEAELKAIVDAIEAYESLRWRDGKIEGHKG